MTTPAAQHGTLDRINAYGRFLMAAAWFILARAISEHAAQGLASGDWSPLLQQFLLVFLLLIGYAGMGYVFDRQHRPVSQQGLTLRHGWGGEFGLGLATGWGIAAICMLMLAIGGGVVIRFSLTSQTTVWLLADLLYFALATLATELVFRGYPFQRLIAAMGDWQASLLMAVLYAITANSLSGSSQASTPLTFVLGLVLALGYCRTRALWLPWGLHFGWVGVRAILFGLPVYGSTGHSPVVQGDPMGPFWLTGGDFGLDGSWFALLVIAAAFPLVYRLTRDLDYRYNAPVLIPGGIALDITAAAQQQHEAAMGTTPAPPQLVSMIIPVQDTPAKAVTPQPPSSETDSK